MAKFLISNKIPVLVFCFCMIALQGYAQQTVRGRVISMQDEQPLPGVNVRVKGTSIGAITDLE